MLHPRLQESYGLRELLYACPGLQLTQAETVTANVCWYSVCHRIFGSDRWESVKLFTAGLGRLDLKQWILWRLVSFLKNILQAGNSLLLKSRACISAGN
jgi:hypothetical protein